MGHPHRWTNGDGFNHRLVKIMPKRWISICFVAITRLNNWSKIIVIANACEKQPCRERLVAHVQGAQLQHSVIERW
jgi:hypothetical protein